MRMLSRCMVVSVHLGVSDLLYICRVVYAVLFCYVYQLTGWLLDMIPRILLRGFGLFRTGDNFGFSGLKYTFNSLSVRMTLILLRYPSFECECIGWIRLGYHYSMNTKPKSIIHWRACCSHFFYLFSVGTWLGAFRAQHRSTCLAMAPRGCVGCTWWARPTSPTFYNSSMETSCISR